ncbi:MAG: hypothetical protein FKGGLIKP_00303 [Sodalis sp. Fse]|nr:MAG: hypothetical protein FKGGLIKP_00303 [Sodalis sp. Fse]
MSLLSAREPFCSSIVHAGDSALPLHALYSKVLACSVTEEVCWVLLLNKFRRHRLSCRVILFNAYRACCP